MEPPPGKVTRDLHVSFYLLGASLVSRASRWLSGPPRCCPEPEGHHLQTYTLRRWGTGDEACAIRKIEGTQDTIGGLYADPGSVRRIVVVMLAAKVSVELKLSRCRYRSVSVSYSVVSQVGGSWRRFLTELLLEVPLVVKYGQRYFLLQPSLCLSRGSSYKTDYKNRMTVILPIRGSELVSSCHDFDVLKTKCILSHAYLSSMNFSTPQQYTTILDIG